MIRLTFTLFAALLAITSVRADHDPTHTEAPPVPAMIGVAPLDLDAPQAGMDFQFVPPLQGLPVTLDCDACAAWMNIRVEDGSGGLIVLHQTAHFEVDHFDLPGYQQIDLIVNGLTRGPGTCFENTSENLCSMEHGCYWTIKAELRWSVDPDETQEPNDFYVTVNGPHEPFTDYTKQPGDYEFGSATHIVGSGEYTYAPLVCGSSRDVQEIEFYDTDAVLTQTLLYRVEITAGCSPCDSLPPLPLDITEEPPVGGGGGD